MFTSSIMLALLGSVEENIINPFGSKCETTKRVECIENRVLLTDGSE